MAMPVDMVNANNIQLLRGSHKQDFKFFTVGYCVQSWFSGVGFVPCFKVSRILMNITVAIFLVTVHGLVPDSAHFQW
jgi:hypothetical protein